MPCNNHLRFIDCKTRFHKFVLSVDILKCNHDITSIAMYPKLYPSPAYPIPSQFRVNSESNSLHFLPFRVRPFDNVPQIPMCYKKCFTNCMNETTWIEWDQVRDVGSDPEWMWQTTCSAITGAFKCNKIINVCKISSTKYARSLDETRFATK